MYFQTQDTKYSVCIHVDYFTTVAVTVYDTGRHRPCGWMFFHSTHGPRRRRASLSLLANERRTCYRFFDFWPRMAYPCVKGHQKGKWPTVHVDLPSYKISARSRARWSRYALPKFFLLFGPWGANPWAKFHQKGRGPGGQRGLPPCKISLLYANPCPRYPLQKILQTHTYTQKKQ